MAILKALFAAVVLIDVSLALFVSQTVSKRGYNPSLVGTPASIDPNGEYIRVSRMSDGSLIAGYTTHIDGEFVLLTSRSSDNGGSWDHLGEVFRGADADHDCDNAFPIQLPSGRVLYAYRNHDRDANGYKYFRISISYSDDSGVNFRYLSTVDERVAAGVNGLWEPFVRIAQDGAIQVYYSSENNKDDQDNLMKMSYDGGQTWSDTICVSGCETQYSRDGMTGCAPIDNGPNIMCVFENTENAYFTVDRVISHDDGHTWGERQRLYTPRSGNGCDGHQITAGAPQIYNVWGTLVTSFMTNEDHDVCNGYDGGDMKIVTSIDGGNSWSPGFITGPSAAHWPGLFNVDPTHLLALYSRDGQGALSQLVELS